MEISNKIKTYKTSNTTVHSCQYHVIFCTKYRRKVLEGVILDRVKELILSKQNEYHYEILEMEALEDHIHLLIDANPFYGIYETINHIKGFTSRQLRLDFPELKKKLPTLWTRTKFISTCGSVSLEIVKRYIEDQKKYPKYYKTKKDL